MLFFSGCAFGCLVTLLAVRWVICSELLRRETEAKELLGEKELKERSK